MFSIRHTDGSGHRLASDHQEEQLSDLYDELQSADQEHGDVAIKNQSDGWCISAHRDGSVVFGNLLEEPNDEHLYPVTKEQVMGIWRQGNCITPGTVRPGENAQLEVC